MSWHLREGLAGDIVGGRTAEEVWVRDANPGEATLPHAPGTSRNGRKVYFATLGLDEFQSQSWGIGIGDVVGGEAFYRIVCTKDEAKTYAERNAANAAALNRRWEAVVFRAEERLLHAGFLASGGRDWTALGETDMPTELRDSGAADLVIARLTFVARPVGATFGMCGGDMDDSLIPAADNTIDIGKSTRLISELHATDADAMDVTIQAIGNAAAVTADSVSANRVFWSEFFQRSRNPRLLGMGKNQEIKIPADVDAVPGAVLADIPAGQFVSAKGIRELVRPVLEGDNGLLTFGDARPTAADGDDKAAGHLWIFGRERYVRLGTARGAGADQTISGWRRINGAVRVFDGSEPHPSGNVLDLVGEDFADYVLGGGVRRWKWDDFGFLNFFVSSADTDGLAGTYTTRRDDFRRTFHTGYRGADNTVLLNLSAGLSAAQFDVGDASFPAQEKLIIYSTINARSGGDLERYYQYTVYAANFTAATWNGFARTGDSAFGIGGVRVGVRPSVKSIWGVIGK